LNIVEPSAEHPLPIATGLGEVESS
jgi:hypothetical protein